MSNVIALPTANRVADAWERYTVLVRASRIDPSLADDIDHQMSVARAWAAWRDLFLAADRRAQC